ncbi:MAG: zinc-ribbon domain containing protein [Chloroflexi bacterium]|nr:zinc-ribbon domain containing protein [Chloroflexota bacterium]
MTDKDLTCRDCGATFAFTVGEQEFYRQQGFTNEPSRCPNCRAARKANRGGDAFGGNASRGFDRPRREMYPAVCAQCGKATEVPFLPRGDKPVYCSDCFTPRRSASHDRSW